MKDNIRVLVVDDSPVMRTILVSMLAETPGYQVVGEATDGLEAVHMTAELRPDVVTMDIRMPRLNGLEATRQIMASTPTPIVVVTTSVYEPELNVAFSAVAAGALTVVEKPQGLDPASYDIAREQLATAIRLVADVRLVALRPAGPPSSTEARQRGLTGRLALPVEIIAIAASTGGPGTLKRILGTLPETMTIPIVIVQHITPGFGQGFAHWLDGVTPLKVTLATNGERVAPGKVLIGPEGSHLTIGPGGIVRLEQSPPIKGLRPSATRLFDSVAQTYRSAAIGVVLTGMGDDGADGLEKLHAAGGYVIAQNEDSCIVFGMPQVAIERGVVDRISAPEEIAEALSRFSGRSAAS
jgi:two-component system, chemotaxis family, protein-glutamate methylesterase/glutaminase